MKNYISPPLEAELLLTTRCNMHCPHCCANAQNSIDEKSDLSTEIWVDAIEQLRKMGVQTFTLTGGEPTLHKGFMKLIKVINTLGAYCAITTNAYFIDEFFVAKLLSLNLDISRVSFHISIDGPEDKHDNFRRTPGAFKKAINAIKKLNTVGIQAKVNFMLTSESGLWFDKLEKIVSEAGCTSINIGQCAPVGRNNISIEYEDWCKFIRNTTRKQKEKMYTCHTRCMSHGIWQIYLPLLDQKYNAYTVWGKKPEVTEDCHTCPAGVFTIAIDGNGWVYPCDLMATYSELRCGNILNNKIVDIWNNSQILHDLRAVDYRNIKPCSTCFLAEECHSGCRGATYGLTGSLEAPDIRCPIVSNYKNNIYSPYRHDVVIEIDEKKDGFYHDRKKILTLFGEEITLIQYDYSYIAKSKWTGNSFMIVNRFGFKVLQMIESGLNYNELIGKLSGTNEKIKLKIEKDIRSFLIELVAKKIISYRAVKDYISYKSEKYSAISIERLDDILPPLIYYKIGMNYLVYITQFPKIVLVNKIGFKIIELYLNGKNISEIANWLMERYLKCAESQVIMDIESILEKVELLNWERKSDG